MLAGDRPGRPPARCQRGVRRRPAPAAEAHASRVWDHREQGADGNRRAFRFAPVAAGGSNADGRRHVAGRGGPDHERASYALGGARRARPDPDQVLGADSSEERVHLDVRASYKREGQELILTHSASVALGCEALPTTASAGPCSRYGGDCRVGS